MDTALAIDLEGKVAVVTGAGREGGIGWEAALQMTRCGASVVVTDVARSIPNSEWESAKTVAEDMSGLEALASQIEAIGGRCRPMAVDVTKREEVEQCIADTVESFGGVDILFNNAGTPLGIAPFLETSETVWDLSWRTNVLGMVYAARAAIPEMLKRGGGSIVNNSSIAGLRGTFESAAYTTTKFAVVGLTKSLAIDFGRRGIRCNAVCPGEISTQMYELTSTVLAKRMATVSQREGHPDPGLPSLGRRGLPKDVAQVVAWLVSDLSSFVTGETIRVDGGWEVGL